MERCIELMAEDPERQRRRQYLVKEKQKITKAQEWLASARKDDEIDEAEDTQPDVKLPAEEWA